MLKAWAVAAAVRTLIANGTTTYVDPGTGSFIFQAVIGGILAVGVALKVYWKRIGEVVRRRNRD